MEYPAQFHHDIPLCRLLITGCNQNNTASDGDSSDTWSTEYSFYSDLNFNLSPILKKLCCHSPPNKYPVEPNIVSVWPLRFVGTVPTCSNFDQATGESSCTVIKTVKYDKVGCVRINFFLDVMSERVKGERRGVARSYNFKNAPFSGQPKTKSKPGAKSPNSRCARVIKIVQGGL